MPRLDRAHMIAALLAALVIPAASRVFGSGRLAWTMFSKTESHRLVITGARASGPPESIAPTALAALAMVRNLQENSVIRTTCRWA